MDQAVRMVQAAHEARDGMLPCLMVEHVRALAGLFRSAEDVSDLETDTVARS